MERRDFIVKSSASILATAIFPLPFKATAETSFHELSSGSGSFTFDPSQNIIHAPKDPALWPEYRQQLAKWRTETLKSLKYDDLVYKKPEFIWASSAYTCYMLMMWDETFYDPKKGNYTIEAFLDQGVKDFGGFDSLVLWQAYPRIGVDQRNQYDFYRDMPGGLEGVKNVVHTCQKRGVRVFICYNPWDTGTHRENKPDFDVLVEMVQALDVDGIFLDTMSSSAKEFRKKLDAARPGVILEGEVAIPAENLADQHASGAQHFKDSEVPGVLRLKWLERRHIQHQLFRWKFDHSGELQTAWINGSGMMVWENVFGAWLAWNARDRSLLRSILPIQRRFTTLFSGEGWTPLVPVEQANVFASEWTNGKMRLWTLVNRSDKDVDGTLLKVDLIRNERYFDLISGCETKPAHDSKQAQLVAKIPARGLGCILAAKSDDLGNDFQKFLDAQAAIKSRFDSNFEHPRRDVKLKSINPTDKVKDAPSGMVRVQTNFDDRYDDKLYSIYMRVRECGFYDSMTENEDGYWFTGWKFQTQEFRREFNFTPYAIDETPVTNQQFADFLKASQYHPKHTENFLRHWEKGSFPSGKADHPVVWIDLDDARAYAQWAGKRLPTEEEWQFAAQGPDALEYPWGNFLGTGYCNLGETDDTTPVRAFTKGISPFGCFDMCGNVWQWTESERTDGRTRFCIIRGGSYFQPKGSSWYVDGGVRATNFATKFLLMWPGLDRCATIGFRCAVDLV